MGPPQTLPKGSQLGVAGNEAGVREGAESAGLGNLCTEDFLWPATPRGTQLALPNPQTLSCGVSVRVDAPPTILRLLHLSNSEAWRFKPS